MARYLPGALGLLAVGLQAAPQQSPSTELSRTARVEGHVVSLADGRALAGASVRLRRESEVLSAPDPNEAANTTRTDPDGLYVFDGVDPGSYRIYANQPGHVRGFYGARSPSRPGIVLQLRAGQALKGLDIKLPTQGSIAGHVENQDREPVSDASVSALLIVYDAGRRVLGPMAFTDTNADGDFTLRQLPPGKYYVRVEQKAIPFVAGSTKKGQRDVLQKTLRQTYYPNSEDAEAAAPLTVAPGTQLTGIDFRVKPGKMFRVRGKVVWGGVRHPERPLVVALNTTAFDVRAAVRPYFATVQDDGTFRFEEVIAGTYYLEPARILVDVGKQRDIGGSMLVEVRDRDLSDIEFPLVPAPDLTGRVLLDATTSGSGAAASGDAPVLLAASAKRPRALPEKQGPLPPPPPSQASTLPAPAQTGAAPAPAQTPASQSQPVQNGSPGSDPSSPNSSTTSTGGAAPVASAATAAAQTAAPNSVLGDVAIRLEAVGRIFMNEPQVVSSTDGTFSLHAVPLGRYRVTATNLAERTYVKSVSFSGRDITNSDLDLTSGVGGELSVVLAKDAGELTGTVRDLNDDPLAASVVSLWRTDRGLPDSCLTAETGNGGAFRLKHLAPGEYRVVAWEEIDQGLAGSGNFCRMFSSDSTSVTIGEHGGVQSVNLKAVSSARIEEAVWKLPR